MSRDLGVTILALCFCAFFYEVFGFNQLKLWLEIIGVSLLIIIGKIFAEIILPNDDSWKYLECPECDKSQMLFKPKMYFGLNKSNLRYGSRQGFICQSCDHKMWVCYDYEWDELNHGKYSFLKNRNCSFLGDHYPDHPKRLDIQKVLRIILPYKHQYVKLIEVRDDGNGVDESSGRKIIVK